jgi:hypothetical protein
MALEVQQMLQSAERLPSDEALPVLIEAVYALGRIDGDVGATRYPNLRAHARALTIRLQRKLT